MGSVSDSKLVGWCGRIQKPLQFHIEREEIEYFHFPIVFQASWRRRRQN